MNELRILVSNPDGTRDQARDVATEVRERLEERLTTSGVLLPGADDETLGQLREQVDRVLDRVVATVLRILEPG